MNQHDVGEAAVQFVAGDLLDNQGNRITSALVEGLVIRLRQHLAVSTAARQRLVPQSTAMEPVDLSAKR